MSDASLLEQLLSAFVDDQLTGLEKKRAEQLIAENPHYAELVEQWRAQRERIRALPRFRLDRDFSDRVLANYNLEHSVADRNAPTKTPGKYPISNSWDSRSAAAAILALAGMILLTLFVFPRGLNLETASKFEPPNSGAESSTEITRNKLGDRDELEVKSVDTDPDGEKVGMVQSGSEPAFKTANTSETKSEELESKTVEPEPASSQVLRSDVEYESEDFDANRGMVVAPIHDPTFDLGIAWPEQKNIGLTNERPQALMIQGGGAGAGMAGTKIETPDQNLVEIWFVEMKVPDPIEKLRSALGQNQIEFPTQQLAANSINSTQLHNSQAVYVRASESQFRRAIALLTDVADITSYSMPFDDPSVAVADNVGKGSRSRNGLFESPVSSAARSTAQLIQQDLFLSRDSDSALRFKSHFGMSVPAVPGVDPDVMSSSKVAADKTSESPQTRSAESPSFAKSESNRANEQERAAPLQQAHLDQGAQPREAGKREWFELDEKEGAPDTDEKLTDDITSDARVQSIAQENAKRFLLLIRFDGDPTNGDAANVPVAPEEKR